VSRQDKLLMEKLRLARDGAPGTATIPALGDDGARTARIRVQPDNGELFETTIELLKGHIEVGQSVRVRFNPAGGGTGRSAAHRALVHFCPQPARGGTAAGLLGKCPDADSRA